MNMTVPKVKTMARVYLILGWMGLTFVAIAGSLVEIDSVEVGDCLAGLFWISLLAIIASGACLLWSRQVAKNQS